MSTLGDTAADGALVAGTAPVPVDAAVEAAGTDRLHHKVVLGLVWKLVSQVVLQGSRSLVGLILARLLTPHDFGIAALAMAFSGLALVLADPALTASIVQRRTITEADRSTVFWTTLAAGVACTIAGVALSGPIASLFHEPSVRPLVAVESACFVLISLSATQVAIMTREMSFRGLELRDMVGTVVGAVVGVVVALLGGGAWAIIAQSVATALVATVLLWRFATWRPTLTFSGRSLRECGSFGSKLLATRLLSFLNLNADNLLVGRYLGSSALGTYSLAYNVMFAPLARITSPIQAVMVPAFSRLQDDRDRLGLAWLRGARLSAAVSVPAFLGMLAIAPDFVPVVLGDRWHAAVPVLQLLCVSGIMQGIQLLQLPVLQARGRAGSLLRYSTISTGANLLAFAIGLRWGIVGVAAAFGVARTLLVPFLTAMTCREVGQPLIAFGRALSSVVIGSALMCACVAVARLGLADAGLPAAARLPLLVALGVAVYGAHLFWRAPDIMSELRRVRAGREPAKA